MQSILILALPLKPAEQAMVEEKQTPAVLVNTANGSTGSITRGVLDEFRLSEHEVIKEARTNELINLITPLHPYY